MRQLLTGGKANEPDIPTPEVLRNILTELGPVYVKLGQLLSTRPDLLPSKYIEALSSLQSTVPPVPAGQMEAFIRQHLPQSPEELFDHLDYTAIAAGSIGQIHKAVLKDGRSVALKVQRPGIDRLVERDMTLIRDVARLMSATQFGQRYNVVDLAQEFSEAIRAELDFTTEAEYTDLLRHNLNQSDWFDPSQLVVPEILWELTSSKLLVMEWLEGAPILTSDIAHSLAPEAEAQRQAITTLLFRAFFQQYFGNGFFHDEAGTPRSTDSWQIGVAFPDLFLEGSQLGIYYASLPSYNARPYMVEGYYSIPVSRNLTLTPALIYGDLDRNATFDRNNFYGALRATFTF